MNVIGYTRVSTAEQENSGHGLAAQEQRIREACERKGWTLLEIVREQGSGKDLDRPQLQALLARLAKGEADGLMVAKMDRLSRSVIDFATLLEWFKSAELAFVALDFDIDTSTPGGKLIASIVASVAEWERDIIGQRTSDALRSMKARGLPVGPGSVADLPGALQRIQTSREAGMTLRQIAEALNAEGVPTARGGQWSASTVHQALGHRRRTRRRTASLPKIQRSKV